MENVTFLRIQFVGIENCWTFCSWIKIDFIDCQLRILHHFPILGQLKLIIKMTINLEHATKQFFL